MNSMAFKGRKCGVCADYGVTHRWKGILEIYPELSAELA